MWNKSDAASSIACVAAHCNDFSVVCCCYALSTGNGQRGQATSKLMINFRSMYEWFLQMLRSDSN